MDLQVPNYDQYHYQQQRSSVFNQQLQQQQFPYVSPFSPSPIQLPIPPSPIIPSPEHLPYTALPPPPIQNPSESTPLSIRISVLKTILFVSDAPSNAPIRGSSNPPNVSRPVSPSLQQSLGSVSHSLAASRNFNSGESLNVEANTDTVPDLPNGGLSKSLQNLNVSNNNLRVPSAAPSHFSALTGKRSNISDDAASVTGSEFSSSKNHSSMSGASILGSKSKFSGLLMGGKGGGGGNAVEAPSHLKRRELTEYGKGLMKQVACIFGMSETETTLLVNQIVEEGFSADVSNLKETDSICC
jgi:hypothetical protein